LLTSFQALSAASVSFAVAVAGGGASAPRTTAGPKAGVFSKMRQPANAAPRRVTSKFYFRGLFIPAVKSSKHKNISRCPLPHVSNRFLPRSQVSFGFFRACISKLVRHVPFVLGFKQGARKEMAIQTHYRAASCRLFVVDEAHRFRNPDTNRYRALAKAVIGARVLLVSATPVHNRIGDLFHLFRLFLRDHDLTALGVPSLCRAALGDADPHAVTAAAARLSVSRSRERVRRGYRTGPVLAFPEHASGEAIRAGTARGAVLEQLVTGVAQLEAGGEAAALFRLLLLSRSHSAKGFDCSRAASSGSLRPQSNSLRHGRSDSARPRPASAQSKQWDSRSPARPGPPSQE